MRFSPASGAGRAGGGAVRAPRAGRGALAGGGRGEGAYPWGVLYATGRWQLGCQACGQGRAGAHAARRHIAPLCFPWGQAAWAGRDRARGGAHGSAAAWK